MLRNIVKDFVKPRRVEFELKEEVKEGVTEKYGKFIAEPLERGYGITIGNSLRRIMLSSLPGAAITAVQIQGVTHEFATINGCVEDVTEIILNLKEVVVRLYQKEQVILTLDTEGPCEVTAGMFSEDANVSIINPEHHICTLNEEGKLNMKIVIKMGRGYVTSESNKTAETAIDEILLDSMFAPVRKVNYFVTNTRVGEHTDYDKLALEVWTDGSITPSDAVQGAAYILRDQLQAFSGIEEIKPEEIIPAVEAAKAELEKPKLNDNLFRKIDELELSVRSSNCLENANIKYIGELVSKSETEMLRTKNFGRKSLNEIKEILQDMGLALGMPLDNYPSREELDKMFDTNSTPNMSVGE
ncbi:MAG: DNA-directed RNA polymerase subunit alpha [Deltaproteobacteria bacterium]|jgi:DNA-directed RNA polymerase subunit alpha|nr:DNA-directed RNA polymerase subunit alpha [Deltaproteobacteria bacterium]